MKYTCIESWKNAENEYSLILVPIYILKVMINYFLQNVSLVSPIRSTFFYVTVIFGAPPIKTAKLWCAIFLEPFLDEKTEYGKSTVIAAKWRPLHLQLSRHIFQILFSHRDLVPKKLHTQKLPFCVYVRNIGFVARFFFRTLSFSFFLVFNWY